MGQSDFVRIGAHGAFAAQGDFASSYGRGCWLDGNPFCAWLADSTRSLAAWEYGSCVAQYFVLWAIIRCYGHIGNFFSPLYAGGSRTQIPFINKKVQLMHQLYLLLWTEIRMYHLQTTLDTTLLYPEYEFRRGIPRCFPLEKAASKFG